VSRRALILALIATLVVGALTVAALWLAYPGDRTPEGAYLRVASALGRDRPEAFFAYIETAAQHACFTLGEYRRRARDRVLEAYPEPERTRAASGYTPDAISEEGERVFAHEVRRRGWDARLRRDLSGVRGVTIDGDRATVETVQGTRYSFRRRENGIWGLTLFTADLVAEAEKAARDFAIIDQAAQDYARAARGRPHAAGDEP
jgi:hypothetical protein